MYNCSKCCCRVFWNLMSQQIKSAWKLHTTEPKTICLNIQCIYIFTWICYALNCCHWYIFWNCICTLRVASKIMIHFKPCLQGLSYIEIRWFRPQYDPVEYQISYKCRLKYAKSYYVDLTLRNSKSNCTSYTLTGLRPGTICKVNLIALYNPASIDQGTSFTVKTLGISKCKFRLIRKKII